MKSIRADKADHRFAVVRSLDDDGSVAVTAVSQNWLASNLKTFKYPPPEMSKGEKVKCIKRGEEPGQDWPTFEVSKVYQMDIESLKEVCIVQKKYAQASDPENCDNAEKRLRKPNKKYIVSADRDDFNGATRQDQAKKERLEKLAKSRSHSYDDEASEILACNTQGRGGTVTLSDNDVQKHGHYKKNRSKSLSIINNNNNNNNGDGDDDDDDDDDDDNKTYETEKVIHRSSIRSDKTASPFQGEIFKNGSGRRRGSECSSSDDDEIRQSFSLAQGTKNRAKLQSPLYDHDKRSPFTKELSKSVERHKPSKPEKTNEISIKRAKFSKDVRDKKIKTSDIHATRREEHEHGNKNPKTNEVIDYMRSEEYENVLRCVMREELAKYFEVNPLSVEEYDETVFPIETIENFKKLENSLKTNLKYRKEFERSIANVNQDTMKKLTNSIIGGLLGRAVLEINYNGVNNKTQFSNSNTCSIITNVVKTKFPNDAANIGHQISVKLIQLSDYFQKKEKKRAEERI